MCVTSTQFFSLGANRNQAVFQFEMLELIKIKLLSHKQQLQIEKGRILNKIKNCHPREAQIVILDQKNCVVYPQNCLKLLNLQS